MLNIKYVTKYLLLKNNHLFIYTYINGYLHVRMPIYNSWFAQEHTLMFW